MRDPIEKSPEDGQLVAARNDAGLTIDTAHWTGPWVAGQPAAESGGAPGARQTCSGKRDRPHSVAHPAPVPRRHRFISLASGIVVAFLLLLVPRAGDRPEPGQVRELAPMARLSGETVTAVMLPRSAPEADPRRSASQDQLRVAEQELTEVRKTVAALHAQLQAETTRTEQALRQEAAKATAQAHEAATARQELAAAIVQHHQVLDAERAQRAALADELAGAQRDLQAQAAQLRSANDDIEQLRQLATAMTSQSLVQERQKATVLVQELAAARQELGSLATQHRQALEHERAQHASLAAELSAAQREVATQAAQLRKSGEEAAQLRQAEAAKAAQALDQERQKTAAFAQAAAARQALTATAAQHRQALDEERAQRAALASELATARRDLELQAVQLRKASDEAGQLRRAEAVKTAQALELERQNAAAVAQLDTARQEQAASTAQHRQTLDEERAQRSVLARELSVAQREIEAQTARLDKARIEAEQLKQASETVIADLRQALRQERDRAAAATQELVSLRAASARSANAASESAKALQAVASVATAQSAAAEARNGPEAARLVARASALLGQGDIGSARVVLERALEMGSARASFMLAETYDPRVLSAWGTYGTRSEVRRARELYARAQAGGIAEAKDRVEALRQVPDG